MAFLKVVKGNSPGQRFDLVDDRTLIGRSSECGVCLNLPSVSRQHAAIAASGGRWFIEDLQSRNKTFLNERQLAPRQQEPLTDGDQVMICDQWLVFYAGDIEPLGLGGPTSDSSLLEPKYADESPPAAPAGDETGSAVADTGASPPLAISPGDSGQPTDTGIPAPITGEEEEDDGTPSVQATLEMGGSASASWRMSAKPEVKLAAMVEITQNLARASTTDEILEKLLDSLFKIFVQADRSFVAMRPQPEAPLVPVATKARKATDEEGIRISRTIAREALDGRKAILSQDAASDERFGTAQSIAEFSIRSMMCAPILDSSGNPLGLLQVDTLNQRSKFVDEDLEVLAGVAGIVAVSLENEKMQQARLQQEKVRRDLETARKIQRSLLPSSPPEGNEYHFFEYYESAREVGGDYYDYIPLSGGKYAIIVGDVAGKGVPAALVMARFSGDIKVALARHDCPAQAVSEANSLFCEKDWHDKFVTMIVAVLDPSSHQITIVNAGHMPPILRSAQGDVEEIGEEAGGPPIGVVSGWEYEAYQREIVAGDSITIFTDGFSEAMNGAGELYETKRLADTIQAANVSVSELGKHILDDVRTFVAGHEQSDDMCLVCLGRDA